MKSFSGIAYIGRIIPVILGSVGIVLGVYSVKTRSDHESLRQENESLRSGYTVIEPTAGGGEEKVPGQSEIRESEVPIDVDFGALKADGYNVAAWIYFPGTGINYPVAKGEDNEFYLTHAADGSYNCYGCIFEDAAGSAGFDDANTVLYGHHMADGTMFAPLSKYKTAEYAAGHAAGWVLTPDKRFRAYVYSCYVTYAGSPAYRLGFQDCDDYAGWLEKTMENSLIPAEINPDISCRILTMSTCSYEYENARCVVHAVLVPCR